MAKGGGAWKVAYADFVTAMMAFFLVMWICGQDQKVRQAVSFYFNDPTNSSMVGNSKQPTRSGSVAELNRFGSVPDSESVALGRGRKSHSTSGERSPATKLVSDWVYGDNKQRTHWDQQAKEAKRAAKNAKEVQEKRASVEETATLFLARSLKNELVPEIAAQTKGLQQDLLYEITSQINWWEIAEDLINR